MKVASLKDFKDVPNLIIDIPKKIMKKRLTEIYARKTLKITKFGLRPIKKRLHESFLKTKVRCYLFQKLPNTILETM